MEWEKWYAYGTSITNIASEGKYASHLARISGMELVNKGISGGGIGDFGAYSHGQVYAAICSLSDGKAEADLITLETGANDVSPEVPLGTIYDTGTSTLSGCLNDCIRYLQTNTNAQIVVMPSPASKTIPTVKEHAYYEWAEMIRRICDINRVHFLSPCTNLGFAKLTSPSGEYYVADRIHQTDLGGFVLAQEMWRQIREIPLFVTEMP